MDTQAALALAPGSGGSSCHTGAADITPAREGLSASPAVEGSGVSGVSEVPGRRPVPAATDEEWEARGAKREREVLAIKALQSYRWYAEVFPPHKRGDDEPQTPDPHDRRVSKRMWKWSVERWRLQLKGRCVYSRATMLECRTYLMQEAAGGAGGGEVSCSAPEAEGPKARVACAEHPSGDSGGSAVGVATVGCREGLGLRSQRRDGARASAQPRVRIGRWP